MPNTGAGEVRVWRVPFQQKEHLVFKDGRVDAGKDKKAKGEVGRGWNGCRHWHSVNNESCCALGDEESERSRS